LAGVGVLRIAIQATVGRIPLKKHIQTRERAPLTLPKVNLKKKKLQFKKNFA
jgi:hypothetical protein